MIDTTDPRLLGAVLANLGPNDPIVPPPEPDAPEEGPPMGGGEAMRLMLQASQCCTRIVEAMQGEKGQRLCDLAATYQRAIVRWRRRLDALPGATLVIICEQCLASKPESAFTTFLQAPPDSPAICDACLDTLPMDLVMALRRQNDALTGAPEEGPHRDHHDKTPRTETIARVMKRFVVLETGEKFGLDGIEWGGASQWERTRIESLPNSARPVAAPSGATEDRTDTSVETSAPSFDFGDRPAVAPQQTACVYCANGDTPEQGQHWFTSPSGHVTEAYPCAQIQTSDPQNDVCWSCGDQLGNPTLGPALCGTCQEAGEQYPQIKPTLDAALATSASPEPAIASVAPAHCPNLAACDSSSCPTCDPLLTVDALGESYFSKLHDDPIAFLLQFDGRDRTDQESIIVAIAAWGGEAVDYVGSFIDRSRARAMALGMLGTYF